MERRGCESADVGADFEDVAERVGECFAVVVDVVMGIDASEFDDDYADGVFLFEVCVEELDEFWVPFGHGSQVE